MNLQNLIEALEIMKIRGHSEAKVVIETKKEEYNVSFVEEVVNPLNKQYEVIIHVK